MTGYSDRLPPKVGYGWDLGIEEEEQDRGRGTPGPPSSTGSSGFHVTLFIWGSVGQNVFY